MKGSDAAISDAALDTHVRRTIGFGRRTRRRAWVLVILACVVAVAAAAGAVGVSERMSPGGWFASSSASVQADRKLAASFQASAPQLVLLAQTSSLVDSPRAAAAGADLARRVAADRRVVWLRSYWPERVRGLRTADGHVALVMMRFRGSEREVRQAAKDVTGRFTGKWGPLRVAASGEAAVQAETERLSDDGLRLAEPLAVPVALSILLWALGSAAAALLPVVAGGVAVVVTMAFLKALSSTVTVSMFALSITMALGFALTVDYSLLLVNRYREELAECGLPELALRRTLAGAGRTVVFSAAVIGVSVGSLVVFPLPFLRSLAYGGVAVVGASAVVSLTVLPALLVLLGPRIERFDVFARLRRVAGSMDQGAWYRVARWVMARPLLVATGVLVLLATMAAPVAQVRVGMYDERVLPASSPVAQTSQELREQFGSGVVDDTTVLLEGVSVRRSAEAVDTYARRVSRLEGVRQVMAVTGTYRGGQQVRLADAASARFAGPAGTWLSVSAVASNPLSPEGTALVTRVRSVAAPVPALVGGPAARLADTKALLADRLPWAVVVTVVATFALLLAFTGSVVIPVKALLLNTAALAAVAGLVVAVFQEGHLGWLLGEVTAGGITDVIVPGLMFCLAFGLSMDYEVFLLSRIVEEHRLGSDTATAVAVGLQRTGPLFTAAALVFASVMACLATSSLILLKLLGIGLAAAVLLDCTVIRALLVPALMRLMGRANWWVPRRSKPVSGTVEAT